MWCEVLSKIEEKFRNSRTSLLTCLVNGAVSLFLTERKIKLRVFFNENEWNEYDFNIGHHEDEDEDGSDDVEDIFIPTTSVFRTHQLANTIVELYDATNNFMNLDLSDGAKLSLINGDQIEFSVAKKKFICKKHYWGGFITCHKNRRTFEAEYLRNPIIDQLLVPLILTKLNDFLFDPLYRWVAEREENGYPRLSEETPDEVIAALEEYRQLDCLGNEGYMLGESVADQYQNLEDDYLLLRVAAAIKEQSLLEKSRRRRY